MPTQYIEIHVNQCVTRAVFPVSGGFSLFQAAPGVVQRRRHPVYLHSTSNYISINLSPMQFSRFLAASGSFTWLLAVTDGF